MDPVKLGPDKLEFVRTGTNPASQSVRALLGLREAILSGVLAPGERISELVLVDKLGVSRTPLRSALIRLESEGLVEPIATGGFAARHFTTDDIFAAIEVRGAREGLAARFAAERRLPATAFEPAIQVLGKIDDLIASSRLDEAGFSDYVTHNEVFHNELAALCASPLIEQQIHRANAHPFASPSSFIKIQASMRDARSTLIVAQDHHRCIIDAIAAGDSGRAENLTREHARLAIRNLHSALTNENMLKLLPGAALLKQVG